MRLRVRGVEATLDAAEDFVDLVRQHHEGHPLPTEREAKDLLTRIANVLRPTSATIEPEDT